MSRLIAEDLLLLCWNGRSGAVEQRCATTLVAGVGGALAVQALTDGLVALDGDRVAPTGVRSGEALLDAVADEAAAARRPPTVKKLVSSMGTQQRMHAVRDRLVEAGVLREERRRFLGLVPYRRHPVEDPAAVEAVRQPVRALLTGEREPGEDDARLVLLAGLAKPTSALELLVEGDQRREAKRRAEAFAQGYGVPEAVGQAVKEAQTAAMSAVTAAVVATTAASSASNS